MIRDQVTLWGHLFSTERGIGGVGGGEWEREGEVERTCKICMDAEVGVVFLPCGHFSCCAKCAKGIDMCPMCRSPIQEMVRTYLS